MSEIKKALEAAREIVDACAGDNRPATGWAANVRTQIDATLSSAAVAEREPVAWRSSHGGYYHGNRKPNVDPDAITLEPLYLDPLPTSELEAEIARLRAERDVAVAAMVRNNERAEVAEARLAEAMKDAERLNSLREMCGYVEDGSSDILKICQDDATGDWLVRTGDVWPAHGRTLRQAIDAAIAARRVREGGKVDG